jgi:hypothetical protein
MVRQLMMFQLLPCAEDAPISDCVTVVICSFLISMVLQFFLQRETNWTSALFRAGDISLHIRSITETAFASSNVPISHCLKCTLRLLTRFGGNMRFPRSAEGNICKGRRLLLTGKPLNCVAGQNNLPLAFNAILAQVFQLFSLVTSDGLYADSHVFAILAI